MKETEISEWYLQYYAGHTMEVATKNTYKYWSPTIYFSLHEGEKHII